MRYFFTLVILFGLGLLPGHAQKNGTVKGVAYDTMAKRPVTDATVTLMLRKDSSLVGFVMTDNAGRFTLGEIAPGDYRLLITHVAYHNMSARFSISDSIKQQDLGQLVMNDRTKVLDEVIVKSEAPPVTLVGDTIQYNAESFKTPPNASVEQLLKKLPGVQVDKDGTVRAQGQKVNKVLVDGKEFFGRDPKMATKNLPADAIDKVQVYDKQSDQSQLTGFDDGNSEKTINLKLKKDKKKGTFGKAMAGAGTSERLEGRFNVNSFKGARQMSVIGMGNNNNTEGFSFMDMMNFTGELSRMMRNGGNFSISDNNPLASMLGNNNRGIRTVWGGGINYNNIIGTKLDFTSNYFYNHYNPRVNSDIHRQYLLPDSSYFYNSRSIQDNDNNTHRLNMGFDYALDSFHSVKINPSLGYQQTRNRTFSNYTQMGQDGQLSNEGYNDRYSSNNSVNFNNDVLFRKKFRRKGRTLSLALQTTYNNSEGTGRFESVNQFYDQLGNRYRTDSINQRNVNENDLRGYSAKLVYTEPLFRRSLVELSVANGNSRSKSDKITYDYNAGSGKYDDLNDSLTNNFSNTYGYTNAGFRLRTQQRKYNYSVGLSWQRSSLQGKVLSGIKDTVIGKTFYNLLPNARLQYNFSKFKSLTFNYRTSTNQPSVEQLQPVPDISNPLAIREGNPDLKQEFSHNVQLNYSGVNPFRNKNLFGTLMFTQTNNKIVNSDSVFSNGVRKSRPVNTDGVYMIMSDINLGLPLKFLKSTFQVGTNTVYNKGRQFINGKANDISMLSVGPRISLDMNPHEKVNVILSARGNINQTRYSLQKAFNTRYFSQQYEIQLEWDLPAGFHFSTEFEYTINNQLAAGFNTRVPLWHASLSKQMLKHNRGELKFRVNDMLNRNIGVTRNSNQNYIEDSRVNTLRRYAMVSFTYSLSKTGRGDKEVNGVRIITR